MHIKLTDIILQESFLQKIKQGISSLINKIKKAFSNLRLGDTVEIPLNIAQKLQERGGQNSLAGVFAEYVTALSALQYLTEYGLSIHSDPTSELVQKKENLASRILGNDTSGKKDPSELLSQETSAGTNMGKVIGKSIVDTLDTPELYSCTILHTGTEDHTDTADLKIQLKKASSSQITATFGFSLKTANTTGVIYIKDKPLDKVFMDVFGPEYRTALAQGKYNYAKNRAQFIEDIQETNPEVSTALQLFAQALEFTKQAKKNAKEKRNKTNLRDEDFISDEIFRSKEEYDSFCLKISQHFAKALDTSLKTSDKARQAIFNLTGISDNTALVIGLKNKKGDVIFSKSPEVIELFEKWKQGVDLSASCEEGSTTIKIYASGAHIFSYAMNYGGSYQKFRVNWNSLKIS